MTEVRAGIVIEGDASGAQQSLQATAAALKKANDELKQTNTQASAADERAESAFSSVVNLSKSVGGLAAENRTLTEIATAKWATEAAEAFFGAARGADSFGGSLKGLASFEEQIADVHEANRVLATYAEQLETVAEANTQTAATVERTGASFALPIRRMQIYKGGAEGVAAATDKVREKSGGLFRTVVTLNQGWSLLRKTGRAVEAMFANTVSKAIEYRSEMDAVRIASERQDAQTRVASARIGDLFVPAVLGLKAAYLEATEDAADFGEENKKVTQIMIANWAVDGARALTSGLAVALNIVNKSVHGLEMGYHGLAFAALSFAQQLAEITDPEAVESHRRLQAEIDGHFAAMNQANREMEGFDKRLDELTTKAGVYFETAKEAAEKFAGKTGTLIDPEAEAKRQANADSIIRARLSAIQDAATIEEQLRAVDAARHSIAEEKKLAVTRDRFRAMQDMLRDLDRAQIDLQTKELARQEMLASRKIELERGVDEYMIANLERLEEQREREREIYKTDLEARTEHEKNAIEQLAQIAEKRGQMVADFAGSAFGSLYGGLKGLVRDLASNTKDAGEVAISFIGGLAEAMLDKVAEMGIQWLVAQIAMSVATKTEAFARIQAYAAEAAAAAFAANIGIPVVGPAIAVGEAAAAYAATMAFASGLAFREGGIVPQLPGTQRGVDGVPIVAAPGEGILPVWLMDSLRALVLGQRPTMDGGGGSAPQATAAPVGAPSVHVHYSSLDRPDRGWGRAIEKSVGPELSRAYARGTFNPSRAGRYKRPR
jgi:hypothetical protein